MLAVKVVFVDTLHLFPETLDFLKEVEARYGFTAHVFTPKDFTTVDDFREVHGVDLPIRDIEMCAASAAGSQHRLLHVPPTCLEIPASPVCPQPALPGFLHWLPAYRQPYSQGRCGTAKPTL